MLPPAAEMQKVLLLAYYCKIDVNINIFNGELTIKATISVKFCHLKAVNIIF